MRWTLFVATAVLGCGDDPPTCEVPATELPAAGDYIDPYAFALPAECVEGGLGKLPGRWFVRDTASGVAAEFNFEYPAIEGSCSEGFRRFASEPDDHDILDDGAMLHTWSDGTRFFRRSEQRYELSDGSIYTSIEANVMCMLPDDSVAAAYVEGFSVGTDAYFTEWSAIGTRFARKDEPSKGLELVGELPMTSDRKGMVAVNLVVDGGFAYIAAFTGFEVVDVHDPANPVHVGHFRGDYNDVRLVSAAGSPFAILSPAGNDRTLIVDVTRPNAPELAAVIPSYSHSLFVQQRGAKTELYLAGNEDIPTFDITNPRVPVQEASVPLQGQESTHDLFVAGDMLYVNHANAGFVAVDVSAGRDNPIEVARVPATGYSHASWLGTAGGRSVLLHGDEGMTRTGDGGAFMRVFDGDRNAPTFMTEIGRYQTRPEVGIHNIELHGDRAYIAYYQDGVRIVDLSDPTSPVEVAHYNTWDPETAPGAAFEGAVGIRYVDGLIYVADDVRGLIILRETP